MNLFCASPAAEFSPCRRWRYVLRRAWSNGPRHALFIMLNPSTADETNDDPTIRRCISFAKTWGMDRLTVCNIFAYRSTDPYVLSTLDDPIGPENDRFIHLCYSEAQVRVAAWGVHGALQDRGAAVASACPALDCLGTTKDGHPRHPLYVAGATELRRFN